MPAGAGRGIALALGAAGWRVYLTGRTVGPDDAAAVTAAGGEESPSALIMPTTPRWRPSSSAWEAKTLNWISLVNNAAVISDVLTDRAPFWEKPWPSAT